MASKISCVCLRLRLEWKKRTDKQLQFFVLPPMHGGKQRAKSLANRPPNRSSPDEKTNVEPKSATERWRNKLHIFCDIYYLARSCWGRLQFLVHQQQRTSVIIIIFSITGPMLLGRTLARPPPPECMYQLYFFFTVVLLLSRESWLNLWSRPVQHAMLGIYSVQTRVLLLLSARSALGQQLR